MDGAMTHIGRDVRLIEPTIELQDEFADMAQEWLDQEGTLVSHWEGALDDFAAFVHRLLDEALPEKVNPGCVPCTHLWLVADDGRIVGTSRLRHWLVPHLEREGGHIGYDVRPSERERGYGTCLLALTLQKAASMGLSHVLVTCDEDNVASIRVIERNGESLYFDIGWMPRGERI
jgi:predicted acetyltransferase